MRHLAGQRRRAGHRHGSRRLARAAAAGTAAVLRRQPARSSHHSGRRPSVRADVVERKGLRRHLLRRELLIRCGRGLIVVPNRGVPQNVQANNAWVSLINHDGSVHTARWIGVQNPAERANLTPPLVLNEPYGSDIANGILYVADRDGGTSANEPSVAVIRRFDMRTGAPAGEVRVQAVDWINDIEVADDGTMYATRSGSFGNTPDPATWQVWKIAPNGTASIFVQGAPLFQPNGVAFDPRGNIVVVNVGDAAVLTFSPSGRLLNTEQAAQPGSDGLVIMADGTKYVSSVRQGGVSRIRPGRPAELIARNIPSAASMCYDAGANQLVIPMNPNNGLAFVRIE